VVLVVLVLVMMLEFRPRNGRHGGDQSAGDGENAVGVHDDAVVGMILSGIGKDCGRWLLRWRFSLCRLFSQKSV
jgi:hypothetical protein